MGRTLGILDYTSHGTGGGQGQLTDRNVILVKGLVVFAGSGDELKAKPELLHQHLGI